MSRSARDSSDRPVSRLRAWARRHAYSLLSSLGALTRQPLSAAMTCMVLAVALSLPLGLHVTVDNVAQLSRSWERLDSLSVFLDAGTGDEQAMRIATRLASWPEVLAVDPISPAEGLRDLSGQLSLGELTDAIPDNPLPWVLEVVPAGQADIAELAVRLEAKPGVDLVIVDLQWLERLDAMLGLIANAVRLMALLFALGVVFIVGNTIRMEIHNRREEIEVLALVGATSGFIRRPFLYSGLWFGLLGGLVAWLLIRVGLFSLGAPIERMGMAYGTEFSLTAPSAAVNALLIGGSGLLGVIGSWLVVDQYVRKINPG